jgi:hypothetical protein
MELADSTIARLPCDLVIDQRSDRRVFEPGPAIGIASIGAQERNDGDRPALRASGELEAPFIGRARCDRRSDTGMVELRMYLRG